MMRLPAGNQAFSTRAFWGTHTQPLHLDPGHFENSRDKGGRTLILFEDSRCVCKQDEEKQEGKRRRGRGGLKEGKRKDGGGQGRGDRNEEGTEEEG